MGPHDGAGGRHAPRIGSRRRVTCESRLDPGHIPDADVDHM
ncbi:hypothetical protein Ae263Ps1_0161c [Pseudonocardia sp. Ae263_Ps1]|nr:hypothetical protein Ae150APs1_5147 [Pseudonocardia sp. Ae150A_Ps1]OLL83106.1 hypothetical protein Ae263Ps1_0161c [Pseudonocardia sp. Ae263_Ps1]OLL90856.1 hypothetical protein Ae356Ps1_0753 [Pseudonocardia sp. Ae356_Ps1]